MPWWGWMIVGALLLGAELLGVDAAFFLLFIGAAAILTGLVSLADLGLAPWMEWVVFATLALTAMVFFRKRVYKKLRGVDTDYPTGPTGEYLIIETTLQPGDTCRQSFHGSEWTVRNAGATPLEAGARTRITGAESLTLIVGE